jgi:S-adenosylmethionine:tRNA ribosyltransferase-isomerase
LRVLRSDFNYNLPEDLIAQEPLEDRSASRMLHVPRSGLLTDRCFRDLPDILRRDDLLVLNNTRVFPARLYGRRSGSRAQQLSPRNPAAREFLRGKVEVLLTRQVSTDPNEWECLVRPGRKIRKGESLFFGEGEKLQAEVTQVGEFGERRIRFRPTEDFFAEIERAGHVPLPPYISREDQSADRERYQTVYAKRRGSVAAPTAGLHFTPDLLKNIRDRGMDVAEITLHVGLGTFQLVHEDRIEDHKLHSEWYEISNEAAEKINVALSSHRRVVAVGTTTVRTLEHSALVSTGGEIVAGSGDTSLYVYPGFRFRVVGALLTNFHLPQSTLLMLVCAFAGRERVLEAYRHAVDERYRFYSYGDCMFLE